MENINCDVDENMWPDRQARLDNPLKIQYLQAFHLLLWTFLFDIWPFFSAYYSLSFWFLTMWKMWKNYCNKSFFVRIFAILYTVEQM